MGFKSFLVGFFFGVVLSTLSTNTMVNDLTTRLLHCITEREGMNDVGRNQFRVTFDHFRRPRLEPFLMSNNINNDVFTAPDETINRTQQVTLSNADIGDNDNNVKIGTQWVPSVSPTSDKKTVTEGENVNVGAGPSDVGGDNNKHHGDAEKQGDGSTSDGDDVNIEINMHIDDDDNKRDGKGDVTSRSTFQRIKHALMHMRKNMKDKIVQLRMKLSFRRKKTMENERNKRKKNHGGDKWNDEL